MAVDVTVPSIKLENVADAVSFTTGDFMLIVKADGKAEILSYALFETIVGNIALAAIV